MLTLRGEARSFFKTSKAELSKLQRMACIGIPGAMKIASTAATEVPIGTLKYTRTCRLRHRQIFLYATAAVNDPWNKIELILQMETGRMMPRQVYHELLTIRFPNRGEWKYGFKPDRKKFIWYTDGSKANKGTGEGVYGSGQSASSDSALCNTSQFSRRKSVPIRHEQLRIIEKK
jgi:hypothetical protein